MINDKDDAYLRKVEIFDVPLQLLSQSLFGASDTLPNVNTFDLALSLRHASTLPTMTIRVRCGRVEVVRNGEMLAVAEELGRDKVRVLVERGSEGTPQVRSLLAAHGVKILDFHELRDEELASTDGNLFQVIRFQEQVDVLLRSFEINVLRSLEDILSEDIPQSGRCEITEVIEPSVLEYVIHNAPLNREFWFGRYVDLLLSFDRDVAKIETWQGKIFPR